jgi:hypothetical protein
MVTENKPEMPKYVTFQTLLSGPNNRRTIVRDPLGGNDARDVAVINQGMGQWTHRMQAELAACEKALNALTGDEMISDSEIIGGAGLYFVTKTLSGSEPDTNRRVIQHDEGMRVVATFNHRHLPWTPQMEIELLACLNALNSDLH